ncbi:hypothetical protein BH09BAC5_BH09BAC5_09760 [soil metagenome]
MKKFHYYSTLADLFRYPGEDFTEQLDAINVVLSVNYPEAEVELKPFVDHMKSISQDQREELFTKTFDVQPLCYLDLGYVIFGEDYKRGAFLLHMQQEQAVIGNDCGSDLSDNICNMLTLFSKSDNDALLDDLGANIMIPGLKKMLSEFETARIELKQKVLRKLHSALISEELNYGNVYRNAINALLIVFEKDFGTKQTISSKEDSYYGVSGSDSFFRKRSDIELENNHKLD